MNPLAATSGSSAALVLSQSDVNTIIIFLVGLAVVVVLQPLILSWVFGRQKRHPAAQSTDAAPSFFEIDYITWFLTHYGIAALAIIAIVILGLDNVIDTSTVAALLGSLFGYVLGSSSKGSSSKPPQNSPGNQPPSSDSSIPQS